MLFDIDGTLLSGATEVHAQALRAAVHTVHGVDVESSRSLISPAGRTDGEIARILLLGAGVPAGRIDERAAEVREECCRLYAQRATEDLSRTIIPGIRDTLDWLSTHDGVLLGLLSGNYESVARVKLRQAGIGQYFRTGLGAFGSDAEARTDLVPIGRRRAGTPGHPHPREDTIVIGDTPRDIACAQADSVRCIAVCTGSFTAQELTAADAVAKNADELRAILDAVLTGR